MPIALEPLVELLKDREPAVRLQAVIALGRIGDAPAIPALLPLLADPDAFLAYSARQALRRIDDWPAAAQGLDSPDPKVRAGVLLAMEQVYDVAAVRHAGGVRRRRRSGRSTSGSRRSSTWPRSIARRPPGTASGGALSRPRAKPPARTIAWDGTPRVMATIRELVDGRSAPRSASRPSRPWCRRATANRARFSARRFRGEKDPEVKRAIALALGKLADREVARPPDRRASATPDAAEPVRDAALEAVEMIGSKKAVRPWSICWGRRRSSADRQPRVIAALGRFKDAAAIKPLLRGAQEPGGRRCERPRSTRWSRSSRTRSEPASAER